MVTVRLAVDALVDPETVLAPEAALELGPDDDLDRCTEVYSVIEADDNVPGMRSAYQGMP